MKRSKTNLYSRAEVSGWLRDAKLGDVDHIVAETAAACALIRAALIVRRGLSELPKYDRPLVARLVA